METAACEAGGEVIDFRPTVSVRSLLENEAVRAGLERHIRCELKQRGMGRSPGQLADVTLDVFQETMERMLARGAAYRPDRPILPLLKTIATRVILNERRRSSHPTHPRCDSRLDEIATRDDEIDTVWELVDRLDPLHRRVIRLRFLQGLKGRSLAAELGLPSPKAAIDLTYRAKSEFCAVFLAFADRPGFR